MKKKMKNVLGLIMVLGLLFNNAIIVMANESSDVEIEEDTNRGKKLKEAYDEKKFQEKNSEQQEALKTASEEEAIEEYEKLIEKVYNENTSKYKSYYAGAYIDDHSDLVVQVSKNSTKIVEDIQKTIDLEEISINSVEYSYNNLQSVYDLISNEMEKQEKDIISEVVSVSISQEENRVIVSLKEITQNKIDEFKKSVSNEECIKFEQSEELSVSANMYLGKQILIGSRNYSIGCRAYAYKDGEIKYGFITAGHNTNVNDNVSYVLSDSSTVKIGKVIGRKCSGNVDCAFVEVTNSDYNVSNHVKSSTGVGLKTYVASSYVEGETIYKSGYAGGTKKGKILSTSCTTTYSDIGVTLKHLYKASYKTKMGDSGGVVYHNDEKNFAGIQSGVQNDSKDADGYYNVCFYIDQYYVFSDWGGLNNIFLY